MQGALNATKIPIFQVLDPQSRKMNSPFYHFKPNVPSGRAAAHLEAKTGRWERLDPLPEGPRQTPERLRVPFSATTNPRMEFPLTTNTRQWIGTWGDYRYFCAAGNSYIEAHGFWMAPGPIVDDKNLNPRG